MNTITNKDYNTMLIANYIIEYCKNNNIKMSNLKLQKIMYYIQARSLVENNTSLFPEKFKKWKYGPAVPSVYYEYKSYGAYDIEDTKSIIRYAKENETPTLLGKYITEDYDPNSIDESDKRIIKDTVIRLKEYEPFELVDLTRKHSLWANYKNFGSEYEDEDIKRFFDNNLEEQLWRKEIIV